MTLIGRQVQFIGNGTRASLPYHPYRRSLGNKSEMRLVSNALIESVHLTLRSRMSSGAGGARSSYVRAFLACEWHKSEFGDYTAKVAGHEDRRVG